jgi:hypothetical protein
MLSARRRSVPTASHQLHSGNRERDPFSDVPARPTPDCRLPRRTSDCRFPCKATARRWLARAFASAWRRKRADRCRFCLKAKARRCGVRPGTVDPLVPSSLLTLGVKRPLEGAPEVDYLRFIRDMQLRSLLLFLPALLLLIVFATSIWWVVAASAATLAQIASVLRLSSRIRRESAS